MSRIGKQPVEVPENVKVDFLPNQISVTGLKGHQVLELTPQIKVELVGSKIKVTRKNNSKLAKSLHGLTRTLIYNAVIGVTEGFEKTLEVTGTGFAARREDSKLILKLGFSHPVEFFVPEGINITVAENKIKVTGVDKAKVGEVAAKIRLFYPPDAYSGKGIRYVGEKLRIKPGKAAKAVGGA